MLGRYKDIFEKSRDKFIGSRGIEPVHITENHFETISKFECQKSKFNARSPKFLAPSYKHQGPILSFPFRSFEFVSSFDIRISDFLVFAETGFTGQIHAIRHLAINKDRIYETRD